ncbi:hypothetical protein [Mammaliicoccus sciuri]|uniref:hypothetical protein n=1 Tax=Mammaliicoccus sciuri TaxID=1296 RepID=UPI001625638F|nr:hypothetical protein [Mammaliicoccus sciuri]
MDKRTIKELQKITVDTEVKNVIEKTWDIDLNMRLIHHDTFRIASVHHGDTLELYVYDKKQGNYIKYWTREYGLIKEFDSYN